MSDLAEVQIDIGESKAKIRVLESQLQVDGISKEERIAIRNQITAAEQVLAGLIAERRDLRLKQQTSAASQVPVGYLVKGLIKFSKLRAGCRNNLYILSEECHAKIRKCNPEDGIYYVDRSPDLSFQLIFQQQAEAEDFETKLGRLPLTFRKRKTESDMDISVEFGEPSIVKIVIGSDLIRVKSDDCVALEGDAGGSPAYDLYSDSLASAVELTEDTKLRLLDREDSKMLFLQKPESCNLISQRKFPKDRDNPNNIVFMSRYLHQHFDAIDSSEGIPTFYLSYEGHHDASMHGIVRGKPCQVYETKVHAVFKTELARNELSPFFKAHTVPQVNSVPLDNRIEFVLYFPLPTEFQMFAQRKADVTLAQWKSYDGVLY